MNIPIKFSIQKKNLKKIYPENKIEKKYDYVLKFDGCSKGNPGLAGAGAVIYHKNEEYWSSCKFLGTHLTNNQAEYHALILGLENATRLEINELLVCGDSQLVIKQIDGEYSVKSTTLIELYEHAKQLESNFKNITYKHIYRSENRRADELANISLLNRNSPIIN
jgi:ribonuclease HI